MNRRQFQAASKQERKKLISIVPADLPHLDRKLGNALRSFASAGHDAQGSQYGQPSGRRGNRQ